MKSRDEIVIIMLQCLRLYTLGSRGSRELKTFLKTRLISSRVDQKFKNKEGKYMLLRGKLARRSWAIDAVVGQNPCVVEAVSRPEDIASGLAWNQPQFRFDFASKWPRFSPRSGRDRSPGQSSIVLRSIGDDCIP